MSKESGTRFDTMTRQMFLRGSAMALLAMASITPAFSQDKPIKVGLILPSYDQIRWQNGDQPCFEEEAKKLGMEVSTVASQMSESVQSCLELIPSARDACHPPGRSGSDFLERLHPFFYACKAGHRVDVGLTR